ncbi:hypothetical protein Catovirus_1_15 [Catovirus CTV1]|uniref:Uncharacterized protein n=1 Tax=Catovirus CTV1 TaxID=1977631 RepID=A0A1V0S8D3_9VIRU|nr:hypothetical protein Catovirus_1_15 [Catovirus CTV1]
MNYCSCALIINKIFNQKISFKSLSKCIDITLYSRHLILFFYYDYNNRKTI